MYGQSKWLLFRARPQHLIDFKTIDEASRGPWGALLLLLRMRGRVVVASVGAFVFVASLTVDPFIQQVLSYPPTSSRSGTRSPKFPLGHDLGFFWQIRPVAICKHESQWAMPLIFLISTT